MYVLSRNICIVYYVDGNKQTFFVFSCNLASLVIQQIKLKSHTFAHNFRNFLCFLYNFKCYQMFTQRLSE